MGWLGWALLSAVFAAATAILAKIGIAGIGAQRFPIVNFGRWRIAIGAGDESREVISGLAISDLEVLRSRFGLDSCSRRGAAE